MPFTVTTESRDRLALRQLCENCANGQWLLDHCRSEQKDTIVLGQFKRAVSAEMDLLEVRFIDA